MISIAGQFHSGEEITNDGMEPFWNLRNIPDCSFGEGKVLEKPNMGGICLSAFAKIVHIVHVASQMAAKYSDFYSSKLLPKEPF